VRCGTECLRFEQRQIQRRQTDRVQQLAHRAGGLDSFTLVQAVLAGPRRVQTRGDRRFGGQRIVHSEFPD